jgi:hypothetical protein
LFFAEAIPAVLARKLGAHILTETMERRPDIGLDSYDRFFPNQDTLPKGGFGNLIALPLQKRPRESDDSVFLDEQLLPWPDQWAFLSTMQRITRAASRSHCPRRRATRSRRRSSLSLGSTKTRKATQNPGPRRLRAAEPKLRSSGLCPSDWNWSSATRSTLPGRGCQPPCAIACCGWRRSRIPEFYRAQAMRLPTFGKPRVISCAEEHPLHIGLPRGCLDEIQDLLGSLGIECVLRDERHPGVPLSVSFQGTLRPQQAVAAEALAGHDQGVLAATTAFGKTVVAAWLIARRGVSTLVLVHRQQLLEQWVERLATFLGLPARAIGRIGGGRNKPNGTLDVALIQSLVRTGVVDDRVGEYGHLVVDECHHLPASSFEQLVRRAKARYVLGLSATVTRKDGHHPIVFMQCGPVRHRVSAREQAAERPFTHNVWVRPTASARPAPGTPTCASSSMIYTRR